MLLRILAAAAVLFAASAPGNAGIRQQCWDYALATGYVSEGHYSVHVNTDRITKEGWEFIWVSLHRPFIDILKKPKEMESGGYVFNRGTVVWNIRENAPHADVPWEEAAPIEEALTAELDFMNTIEGVWVDCRLSAEDWKRLSSSAAVRKGLLRTGRALKRIQSPPWDGLAPAP